ncbi:MAG: hypothetical protein STHCBS139747_003052 [Sporothrix thermara]
MDGAIPSTDIDSTTYSSAIAPDASGSISPELSPTSTAVEPEVQLAYLNHIGSNSEKQKKKKKKKKNLLQTRVSSYVARVTSRTGRLRTGSLRTNYNAVLWSLLFMLPVILVGYSQSLVVSLLAQPQFQEQFSAQEDDFSAVWMLAVQMCSVASSMLGGMAVGWLSSQYSVRLILGTSLVGFFGCTFVNFWAPSMSFILMGTLLQGLCCGGFGTLASTYITDACTPSISHVMTGMISCC